MRVRSGPKAEGQDFDAWLEAVVWAAPQGTGGRPSHVGIPPPALPAEMGNLVASVQAYKSPLAHPFPCLNAFLSARLP